jgi:hypothetical protein
MRRKRLTAGRLAAVEQIAEQVIEEAAACKECEKVRQANRGMVELPPLPDDAEEDDEPIPYLRCPQCKQAVSGVWYRREKPDGGCVITVLIDPAPINGGW